jgi:bifunctional non-homologous end joining protein LigD
VPRSPRFILPAQPVQRDRPPKGAEWVHEVKFDGYRCQLHRTGKDARVYSKNGSDFNSRFPVIRQAPLALPCKSLIIDTEAVALTPAGVPDFRALHSGNYTQDMLCAWCFDLLELNDQDLRALPLVVRKMKLRNVLKRYADGALRLSESFADPEKLLGECRRVGLEGIVSKRKDQPYRSGKCDWIKVKCAQWKEDNGNRGELFGQRRR